MSTRPIRTIQPPAKYLDDVSDFIQSLTVSAAVPSPTSTESTMSTLTLTLTPTGIDVGEDFSPPSTLAKRPRAWPLVLTIDNDADTTNQDDAPKPKKLKKAANQPAVSGLQNELSIIDIDDIDDTKNEWVNKRDVTADIKEFFIMIPPMPGQDKVCYDSIRLHLLCRYIGLLSFLFLIPPIHQSPCTI